MIGKHVVIDTLDNFKTKLSLIPSSAIVLIKDVGQIYAHGTYFGAQKTYSLLTKTADGFAPKGGTSASSLISDVNTEWVLTVTNGENPTWRKLPANAFSSSSYTLPSATVSDLGGIKVGQVYTATFDDLVGLYYKVNIDKNGLAYVHVPWINNPYTASGSGITLKDNVFSLSLNSVTKLDSAIGNKIYAVSLDKNGKLCVSVPWVDTNNIFVGATETKNGSSGMVPAPIANQHRYFLRGDGTWVKPNLSDLNDDVVNGKYLPKASPVYTGILSTKEPGLYQEAETLFFRNASNTADYGTQIVNNWNDGSSKTTRFVLDKTGVYFKDVKGSSKTIYHSGNFNPSDYLSKSGGKIKGVLKINGDDKYNTPLVIETPSMGDWGFIQFHNGAKVLGHIGVAGVDTPVFRSASGTNNTLIHSGNIGSQSVSYATWSTSSNRLSMLDFYPTDDVSIATLSSWYKWGSLDAFSAYGYGIILASPDSNHKILLGVSPFDDIVRVKAKLGADRWTDWREIAFTDSNVASATNADKLDDVHLAGYGGRAGIMRSWARGTYTTSKQYFGNGNVVVIDPKPTDDSNLWDNTTIFSLGDMEIRSHQLAFSYIEDKILYRRVYDGPRYNSWRTIAFTDSNVSSATKLQTARSIWGQSFDGTGNISGNLSGVWNLYVSSEIILYQNGTNYLTSIRTSDNAFTIQPRIEGTGYNVNTLINPSGGNVGIGTTDPSYKLDVNGGARFGSLTPADGLGVIPFAVANSSYANTGWCASFGTEKGGVLLGYQNSKGVAIIGASKTENMCICPDGGNVGIGTTSPSYKLHVAGDTYTSGWSRADNGFYVEGKGVHYMSNNANGLGQIYLTSNEFNWSASGAALYFNYRASANGTTVTSYVWNAGSSSSYASHSLGNLYIKTATLSTTLPTYDNAPLKFNATANNNDASNSRYQPWISGKDSVNSYGYGVTVSTGIYRDPGYSSGGYYIGCGWDGNANSVMWKFSRNGYLYGNFSGYLNGTAYSADAIKDSNNGTRITACYSTGGFSSNPSWLAAWNGYHLTYVSPGVLSVNYANSAGNADTVDNLHASDFVRAYGTFGTSYSYDSDWGLSIVTFDPVVSGTAPAQNPNISILNIGNNYARRKQLAFTYSTNDIYYRRRIDSSWSGWVRLAISGESYTKTEADSRFINAAGDTMTGTLYLGDTSHYLQYYKNGKYVELYNGTAATGIGVWDNGKAQVFNSSGLYKIWHEGNDGSGSGLNADLLDGYHISVGAAGTNSSTIYFVT